MRHPKIIIASAGLAVAAAVGGATATVAASSPASNAPPATSAPAAGPTVAVRTAQAMVGGKTEAILVNAAGLPLYIYRPDTATKSLVSGQLAAAWPPLTSAAPTAAGLSGKVTVVNDAHGGQVAYNGHLLYTFTADRPGQVTGQGIQDFFVATPGIAPATGASAPAAAVPANPSSGGYGY